MNLKLQISVKNPILETMEHRVTRQKFVFGVVKTFDL
jgi:hypothetical protein